MTSPRRMLKWAFGPLKNAAPLLCGVFCRRRGIGLFWPRLVVRHRSVWAASRGFCHVSCVVCEWLGAGRQLTTGSTPQCWAISRPSVSAIVYPLQPSLSSFGKVGVPALKESGDNRPAGQVPAPQSCSSGVGYYVIAPLSLQFLGNGGAGMSITDFGDVVYEDGRLNHVGCGAVCTLSRAGLPQTSKTYRRHALVAIILRAPTFFAGCHRVALVSLPVLVLYELVHSIAKHVYHKRADA